MATHSQFGVCASHAARFLWDTRSASPTATSGPGTTSTHLSGAASGTRRFPTARVPATCRLIVCANHALNPKRCSAEGETRNPGHRSTTSRCVGLVALVFEIVQSHSLSGSSLHRKTWADGVAWPTLLVGPKNPVGELARDSEQLQSEFASARVRLQERRTRGEGPALCAGRPFACVDALRTALRCAPRDRLAANDVVTTGHLTDRMPVDPQEQWRRRFTCCRADIISVKR